MKFLKKIGKKIFKGVKKVVKKIAKPLAIAALVFLTAGIATAGFGALAFGQGVGAFMSSVGSTMMAGAQGIAGAIGIGSGVTASTAGSLFGVGTTAAQAATGATLFTGTAAQALGLAAAKTSAMSGLGPLSNTAYATATKVGSTSLAGLGGAGTTAYSSLAATKTGATFLGGLTKASSGMGKSLLLSSVIGGAQAWQEQRAYDKERKVQKGLNFFGGPAHGGSSELSFNLPTFVDKAKEPTQERTVGQETSDQLVSAAQPSDIYSSDPDSIFSSLFNQEQFMEENNRPSPLFRGFA